MPYKQIIVSIKFKGSTKESPIIDNAETAAKVIRNISDLNTILWREEAFILCLNKCNRLLGWYRIAVGGIDIINIDRRIIATIALKCTATGIILTHNHPSGNTQPSAHDIETTTKLKNTMDIIGIDLIDHIITTDQAYFSMKEKGLL